MVEHGGRNAILDDLRLLEPARFVEKHIFDRVPHFFGGDRDRFLRWKGQVSAALGVDPAELTMVGSAAVGISLNPYKNFQPFGEHSDLDVAVISSFYFQSAWRFLRQNGALRSKLGVKERGSWDDHTKYLIYWGTVATDRLLTRFPFGPAWRTALDKLDLESETDHPINVRVYSDYEALRSYQIKSVRDGQLKILTKK